eukprot:105602-Pelagomonas_calceolata.AAC.1
MLAPAFSILHVHSVFVPAFKEAESENWQPSISQGRSRKLTGSSQDAGYLNTMTHSQQHQHARTHTLTHTYADNNRAPPGVGPTAPSSSSPRSHG